MVSSRASLVPRRLLAHALAAGLLVTGLAACGSDDPATSTDATSPSSTSGHNDADVAFATAMIPHHAQALAMTDLTLDRELSKDFSTLVDDIRAAQAPEIELMADWLQEWGEPVPETVRDHANAGHGGGGHGDGGHQMPGMMSDQDMKRLEKAPDAAFEDLWLEMMIEHHEGAIAMAETQVAEGQHAPAVELAEGIASSQTDEIALMESMLEG